jgi:hypothetical protein
MSKIVASNPESAYGLSIETCMKWLRDAYEEASLFKQRMLCNSTASRLHCAYSYLNILFPKLRTGDAYAVSEDVVTDIAALFISLAKYTDSDMRRYMQGMCKVRLYASTVKDRLDDLRSDNSLIAISSSDPFPFSLLVDADKFITINGQTFFGNELRKPEDIIDISRPFQELREVLTNIDNVTDRLQKLYAVFAVLHELPPWAISQSKGNYCAYVDDPAGYTVIDRLATVYERIMSMSDFNSFAGFLSAIQANADINPYVLFDDSHSSLATGWFFKGDNALNVNVPSLILGLDSPSLSYEICGTIRTRFSATASAYTSLSVNIDAVGALAIARNGSNTGTLAFGPVSMDYAEYETNDNNTKELSFRIRGLSAGAHVMTVAFATHVPAAGADVALQVVVAPPLNVSDKKKLSIADRDELIKSSNLEQLMVEFLSIRTELAQGVSEKQWMKSYHPYIIGANAAYTATTNLTDVQLTSIKSRMVTPTSWDTFEDLEGFIEKVVEDIGALNALARSNDFS